MCIKKVACGLQKIIKEDGREVLEPIFVEVDCPEDMHSITGKIDSCKTVAPKIVEENVQEVEVLPSTVQNELDGTHGGEHVGATVIDSPITDNNDSPIGNIDSPIGNIDSPREVVCIETGEVFANATQASKANGIARQNITACCNGKRKKAGGYQWKYLQTIETD